MHSFFWLISLLLWKNLALAQTPIGLYEGLLGNSGVALQDSSAASYYNPSLLILKNRNSHAIGGNTFSRYSNKTNTENTSSYNVYPTYLGSVFVSESLVHEIFVVNLTPTQLQVNRNITDSVHVENSQSVQNVTNIMAGYSMAFKSFPIALSYFLLSTQIKEYSFNDFTSLTSNLRSTSNSHGELDRLSGGISVSGHSHWENYTLGYNLKMRPLQLYNHNQTDVTSYIRGENLPSDYRVAQSHSEIDFTDLSRNSLTIGHDFRSGIHEFITDSLFTENAGGSNSYRLLQSFGYRLNAQNGHQFLCGVNHGIGGAVKYFGQEFYVSTGYSWENTQNRSTFGLYYYHSQFDQQINSAGLSFGSEFSY